MNAPEFESEFARFFDVLQRQARIFDASLYQISDLFTRRFGKLTSRVRGTALSGSVSTGVAAVQGKNHRRGDPPFSYCDSSVPENGKTPFLLWREDILMPLSGGVITLEELGPRPCEVLPSGDGWIPVGLAVEESADRNSFAVFRSAINRLSRR